MERNPALLPDVDYLINHCILYSITPVSSSPHCPTNPQQRFRSSLFSIPSPLFS